MSFSRVLIANRGEVAIRIARAANDLGLQTVAVYPADDVQSLHLKESEQAVLIEGRGPAAYLDQDRLIAAAKQTGCDAVHPGYGFLSENADFAARCHDAGLTFIGPDPDTLRLLGDKARARRAAADHRLPLAEGTGEACSLEQAGEFLAALGPDGAIMIKATAGGGGRGIRAVRRPEELAEAYENCRSEALAAFGSGEIYVERLVDNARHIEVQIVGDGTGNVTHLWDRDCSLQRRQQKLVELAPAFGLPEALRNAMLSAAVTLGRAVRYRGLGTIEFLVDLDRLDQGAFMFMEANPRLQVEHTVTEAITGIDLVQVQFGIAAGRTLDELGLVQSSIPQPRGCAMQLRINTETMDTAGVGRPAAGVIRTYEPSTGPGVRVDGYGYAGYTVSPAYDSLLAKLIVFTGSADRELLFRRAGRALANFRLEGVNSNLGFLRALLAHPDVPAGRFNTGFVASQMSRLVAEAACSDSAKENATGRDQLGSGIQESQVPPGCIAVRAPSAGLLVSRNLGVGDEVVEGEPVAVLEAMKMEFVVRATHSGIVQALIASEGASVSEGSPLLFLRPATVSKQSATMEARPDPDSIRADLAEVIERHAVTTDPRRPQAVEKRHRSGQRTVRENLGDLLDAGSFIEYGALALAAQRKRYTVEKLIESSPADGMVAGFGTVNGSLFDENTARCLVLAYDYTVFAGTQGVMNHKKTDRLVRLAEQWRVPLVFYAEGGGGRPSDTDLLGVGMLDNMTFLGMAKLSGKVPIVGVVSGRCFAGNAALLGCCDVIIATENTTLGMAGPALIEGAGLGRYSPEEIGPADVQAGNGVIDVLVRDEAEATRVARQYLSYFQGAMPDWRSPDQRELRHLIPENRLRAYDIRPVIHGLADEGSVLELRRSFAPGLITALVRIEGRPFGLIANNPQVLGGAIDSQGGDKAARFMQLCNAFGLPMLSLCDTPGFMVGPEAEKSGSVRHLARMFVNAANLTVPFFTVVLRKGYGLGAQAMAAGSFHGSFFTVAWPSGEFGPMGLEGAVQLVFGKQLAAIEDPEKQAETFRQLVAKAYEQGKALNTASFLEVDDVIDPADTRRWLIRGLASAGGSGSRERAGERFIDTW